MPATLKRNGQVVATPRALERQALHELDDGRLVLEHLSGDPQAFGTLVDRYQTRLLNFINRTIGDRERAEDLVQEVFIRVFRHPTASIRPRSSRPGSIPSRRTSRRTSFGTAAVTPWCCSRRSRSTGRRTTGHSSSKTRRPGPTTCTASGS